ncbi:MmcQ/YjbR family DNA-binding protein [Hufsiella ginkgonis]|uniref:MmcQ/YjbR family DNA-binding protein n=1 Tax=Hufsiella ginkgonis TaxID=2695274 RepID=A0A7K1XVI0_9SPHI|nr:MmcQ/YjbR family DNA-binding protein [Hufsiella ginkgonis]MXV15015.1 MmcQ/YjbR family DNA-binding protein [Hufsiella ginkgonis]
MNIEELRDYCLDKKGTTEGFPFGEEVLVFKVGGKMFLLAPVEGRLTMNAKCDPDRAVELRERYPEIVPGYHMNKQQWNTVDLTGNLPNGLIRELVDHSYDLVYRKLTKKLQHEIADGTWLPE